MAEILIEKEDLDLLATDPAHQRRGAAGCLLDKLSKLADQAGRVIFLVSTDSARPVYERFSSCPFERLLLIL